MPMFLNDTSLSKLTPCRGFMVSGDAGSAPGVMPGPAIALTSNGRRGTARHPVIEETQLSVPYPPTEVLRSGTRSERSAQCFR